MRSTVSPSFTFLIVGQSTIKPKCPNAHRSTEVRGIECGGARHAVATSGEGVRTRSRKHATIPRQCFALKFEHHHIRPSLSSTWAKEHNLHKLLMAMQITGGVCVWHKNMCEVHGGGGDSADVPLTCGLRYHNTAFINMCLDMHSAPNGVWRVSTQP